MGELGIRNEELGISDDSSGELLGGRSGIPHSKFLIPNSERYFCRRY